ncbi:MAG: presqualene diphosphate synthase HpnD [Bacteroidota bacterium]|jgi:phytoene synthase|nr:presqualene diphosphate synthase HpnD [Bacteroidota bacterium]
MQDRDIAADITRKSKTNFMVSFAMLPEEKRDAIHTVYAFCRCTDDIVDEGGDRESKSARLLRWTEELELGLRNESSHPLLNKLSVIAARFNIPAVHFFDLIHGMRMDLERSRYATFDELHEYCYHVASTVGLMCSEIFGYTNERTRQYAVDLGIALQLTNIVRDVKADAELGRIYLPEEDFIRFGYSYEELLNSTYNENFVRLMRFETGRAREYYQRARASLAQEDHAAFFAARIMDRIYYRILQKIEQKHYALFGARISISSAAKLRIAIAEYFSRTPLAYASLT